MVRFVCPHCDAPIERLPEDDEEVHCPRCDGTFVMPERIRLARPRPTVDESQKPPLGPLAKSSSRRGGPFQLPNVLPLGEIFRQTTEEERYGMLARIGFFWPCILSSIGIIAWIYTASAPPGILARLHYAGLAAGLFGGCVLIGRAARNRRVLAWMISSGVSAAVIFGWWWNDSYIDIWRSRDESIRAMAHYADTYQRRNNEMTHREITIVEDGSKLPTSFFRGPMTMVDGHPKYHGRWELARWSQEMTYEVKWYWRGEEVSIVRWRELSGERTDGDRE